MSGNTFIFACFLAFASNPVGAVRSASGLGATLAADEGQKGGITNNGSWSGMVVTRLSRQRPAVAEKTNFFSPPSHVHPRTFSQGATGTSASSFEAGTSASSIEAASIRSTIRKSWNLWAAAYTAFHELAPSEESIKLWWTKASQELKTPLSRGFFESQLNELKAVQAKAARVPRGRLVTMSMDNDGLKEQAKSLNPVIGYFDPLNLAEGEFWEQTNEATIGWLRESEIKHGRIAMFGFIGYIVHANGIRWPWKGPWENIPTDISPQEMWDLTPDEAKWQIIGTIGFFEFWRESQYVLEQDGEAHYMRGGKPGYFPTFDQLPHPVPFNLYDPFKLSKNRSPESKAKGLLTEINNGRLAMIGLMGFLAESQTQGSVPGLTSLGLKSYSGFIMDPFGQGLADFSSIPR